MNIVPLTKDYALTAFDCGDSDLNEFLLEDAKLFLEKREEQVNFTLFVCVYGSKRAKMIQKTLNRKMSWGRI